MMAERTLTCRALVPIGSRPIRWSSALPPEMFEALLESVRSPGVSNEDYLVDVAEAKANALRACDEKRQEYLSWLIVVSAVAILGYGRRGRR